MALKQRDYSNMRETERVQEAVKLNSTEVKDYSLQNVITVTWKFTDYATENHLVQIRIGNKKFLGQGDAVSRAVHSLVERQDEDDWLPRDVAYVTSFNGYTAPLIIDTTGVNKESLRDHVARVTIEECSSIIDLEELLKATRYA